MEKEKEVKENNESFEQLKKRHEGSNEALMLEIHRLNEELQQYKVTFEGNMDAKKLKDEVMFYRNQCDSLSAQLSRAQAMARRGK